MFTQEQAKPIDDSILLQRDATELEYKNIMAPSIPFLYRFPELQVFQVWERPILIAAARKHAMSQWSIRVVWFVCSMLAVGLAYYYIRTQMQGYFPFVWIGIVVILSPVHLLRRYKMQQYVREQVLNQKGPSPSN